MQAFPFVRTGRTRIPSDRDIACRVPPHWDLRLVQRRKAVPVRTIAVSGGHFTLVTENEMVLLGDLRGQDVEVGWSFTGLRLRGALHIAHSGILLLVPDRADLAYLLRALATEPTVSRRVVPSRAA